MSMTRSRAGELVRLFERAILKRATTEGQLRASWAGKAEDLREQIERGLSGGANNSRLRIRRALTDAHACIVRGCTELMPATRLVCVEHFKRIPEQLKVDLREAYAMSPRGRPTEQLLAVAERVVKSLDRLPR